VAAEEHEHSRITAASSVDVERPAAGLTVISLRGEHDLGSRQALAEKLAQTGDGSDLLVDLSECTFLDSTVLGVLLKTSQEREAAGARLGLVIPPEAHIVYRVTRVAGIAAFLPIYASREAGIASLHTGR
jgi:anti-sigma B factor antagonist